MASQKRLCHAVQHTAGIEADTRSLPAPTSSASVRGSVFQTRRGRSVVLRPASPLDELAFGEFFQQLSPQTRYLRLLTPEPTEALLATLTHRLASLLPGRQVVWVAVTREMRPQLIGIAELVVNPQEADSAELALCIRDDYQGEGIGSALMECLLTQARSMRLSRLYGMISGENHAMLRLLRRSGFPLHTHTSRGETSVEIDLRNL